MFKTREKPEKEMHIPQKEFLRYEPRYPLNRAQLLEEMRAFAEKRPYSMRSMAESDLVKGLREEALRKKKENTDNASIVTLEETRKEIMEYTEKNPNTPKPYFDAETLEGAERKRDKMWKRQERFALLKRIGAYILITSSVLLLSGTIFDGLLPWPIRAVGSYFNEKIAVVSEIISRDRHSKLNQINRAMGHAGDEETRKMLRKMYDEEAARLGREAYEKNKHRTLGDLKQCAKKFPLSYSYSCNGQIKVFFEEGNPNLDLTVEQFLATRDADKIRRRVVTTIVGWMDSPTCSRPSD